MTLLDLRKENRNRIDSLYDIFELVKEGYFTDISVEDWIKKFIKINGNTPEEQVQEWQDGGYDWVDIIYDTCEMAQGLYVILEINPTSYTDYYWDIYKHEVL